MTTEAREARTRDVAGAEAVRAAGSAGEPAGVLTARPRIPRWRRPVQRGADEAQFGTGPGGIIVGGLSRVEQHTLRRLDGTTTLPGTYVLAARAGIRPARWRDLLDLVARLGVLEGATSAVPGGHRPPSPPAASAAPARGARLAHSQPAGRLLVVAPPGGLRLADELVRALQGCGFDAVLAEDGLGPASGSGAPPALALLVDRGALPVERAEHWASHGIAHLPVLVGDEHVTVGPLIDERPDAPCLWCLDLHRTARDAAWPLLTAQLGPDPGSIAGDGPADRLDPAAVQVVAGCIGLYARQVLAGRLPPPGVAVDVSTSLPRMDHRRWTVHPHCARHAAGAIADGGARGMRASRSDRPVA